MLIKVMVYCLRINMHKTIYRLLINIHKFFCAGTGDRCNISNIQQYYEYLLANAVLLLAYHILGWAAVTKLVIFTISFCLQRGLQEEIANICGKFLTYLTAAWSDFIPVCPGEQVTGICTPNPFGFHTDHATHFVPYLSNNRQSR